MMREETEKNRGLSMQIIAMLTMLIDHMGIAFFHNQDKMRIIGRIAFPIYAYLIVQGYHYTRSLKKYFIRLTILFVLSQIPFMLALHVWSVNVIGTFIVALAVLGSLDRLTGIWMKIALVLAASVFLELIPFDYGSYGLALILIYRYLRHHEVVLAHLALNVFFFFYGWNIQVYSVAATIAIVYAPTLFQFIERWKIPRWFWRSFYPAHLAVLAILLFFMRE
jgi:hypothetical protein